MGDRNKWRKSARSTVLFAGAGQRRIFPNDTARPQPEERHVHNKSIGSNNGGSSFRLRQLDLVTTCSTKQNLHNWAAVLGLELIPVSSKSPPRLSTIFAWMLSKCTSTPQKVSVPCCGWGRSSDLVLQPSSLEIKFQENSNHCPERHTSHCPEDGS